MQVSINGNPQPIDCIDLRDGFRGLKTYYKMEIFKEIPGFEKYKVSNMGNVLNMDGSHKKSGLDKYGYPRVTLTSNTIPIRKISINIHKLVALTFLSTTINNPDVNHINGIKTDNNVCNLEYCSRKENIAHSYKMGLSAIGEDRPQAKLSNANVIQIRLLGLTKTHAEIAKIYNISHQNVTRIINRQRWKHI